MGLFSRKKKKSKKSKNNMVNLKESQVLESLNNIESKALTAWTVEDVVVWIQVTNQFKQYGTFFFSNHITGKKLSTMTPFDMADLGVTVDDCAEIFKLISQKKTQAAQMSTMTTSQSSSTFENASVSTSKTTGSDSSNIMVVKLAYENLLKRVKISKNCRIDQLEAVVARELKMDNLLIYWLDPDGDLIAIDTTEALWDVLKECTDGRVKFQLYPRLEASDSISNAESNSNSETASMRSGGSRYSSSTLGSKLSATTDHRTAQVEKFFTQRHQRNKNLQYACIVIGVGGIVKCWNKKSEEFFGFAAGEALGKNIKDLIITSAIAAKHDGFLKRYATNRGESRIIGVGRSVMAVHKDGSSVPIFLTVNEASEPVPFYTAIILKDEASSTAKIAAEDMDYSDIRTLERLPLAAIIANYKGDIQYVNMQFCKLFGYEATKVLGKNLKILMPEPFSSQHRRFMKRYQKTGVKHVIDVKRSVPAKRSDGTSVPIELNVHENVGAGEDGKPTFTGIITVAKNESESQSDSDSDEEEQSLEQHLELINWLNDPHIIIKEDGLIYGINKSAVSLFEYATTADLVGTKLTNLFWNEHDTTSHGDKLVAFAKNHSSGTASKVRTVCGKTKTGKLVSIRLKVRYHKDPNGVEFFVGGLIV